MQVRWGFVPEADYYEVYAAYCGRKECKKIRTVQGALQLSFHKLNKKRLKTGKAVKVYVVAYHNGAVIGRTIVGHVENKDARRTNVKLLVAASGNCCLEIGESVTPEIQAVKMQRHKKLPGPGHCAALRFASSDPSVAVVDEYGTITAVGAGTCDIWAYAHNGCGIRIRISAG